MFYIIKIIITTILVIVISEFSKRNSLVGAVFASLPLISILAILWLYMETQDVVLVSNLAKNIFWLVLPSLIFFLSLPILLKIGFNFYLSIGLSIGLTIGCYLAMIYVLKGYCSIKF